MEHIAIRPVDHKVSTNDLPGSYFKIVRDSRAGEEYDSLDRILPEEAYDDHIRPDLHEMLVTPVEGTHTIKYRIDKSPDYD